MIVGRVFGAWRRCILKYLERREDGIGGLGEEDERMGRQARWRVVELGDGTGES